MLSKKTKYALKALVALAKHRPEELVMIGQLAEQERIPKKFLELILLELKNRGILKSRQGKGGGYALAKQPSSIKVGEVIRLIEGPLALTPCVSQSAYEKCDECLDENICGIRSIMKDVREVMSKLLDGTSLADLIDREEQSAQEQFAVPNFQI